MNVLLTECHHIVFCFSAIQENRAENGGQGQTGTASVGEPQRPRLASVPSRAEDAVDQLQENEKLIAGEFLIYKTDVYLSLLELDQLARCE